MSRLITRLLPLTLTLTIACGDKTDDTADGGDDTAGQGDGADTDDTDDDDDDDDTDEGPEDRDGDGFAGPDDCDDADPDVHPGADETCDGVDNDCDGTVDQSAVDAPAWYPDADGDGHGDPATSVLACAQPVDHVDNPGDCDDSDAAFHPGADEDDCTDPNDYNCDGSVGYADEDGDGWAACEDCDDTAASAYPGATEACDTIDNDCDGNTDEDDATDAATWYADADSDGYGDADTTTAACSVPSGYVADDTDCDDGVSTTYPGADETCDTVDNDCDGTTDEDDATDAATWYADADSDGYGDAASTTAACSVPSGYVADATDCDDTAATTYPGADETCDTVDNDCDGTTDEDDATDAATWYADADSDGYGDAASTSAACSVPSGYVADDSDCDDTAAATNPAATETCDTVDNDCDGTTDEDDATDAATWYADADSDGYGDAASTTAACSAPSGYVADDSDCDDTAAATNPAATETCDTVDNDCDGTTDEDDAIDAGTWYTDVDEDGYGDDATATSACTQPSDTVATGGDCDDSDDLTYPGATELCDGVQNDCDASWSSDAGTATFEAGDGTLTDYTATMAAGTSASPADVNITEEGTLQICEGTWYVNLDIDASMEVVGLDGSDLVVLDGGAASPVVHVSVTDGDILLSGITATNGYGSAGGISLRELAYAELEDVVVTDNESGGWCGGMVLWNVDEATFQGVEVSDNVSPLIAGLYINGPTDLVADDLLITGNVSAGRIGGWMGISGGTYTLTNIEVSDNTAGSEGAGAFFGEITVDIDGALFSGNESVTTGGGMHARSIEGTWSDVAFDGNTSATGGGLRISTDTGGVSCTDCSWTDNEATSAGGAISVSSGELDIITSAFSGNTPSTDVIDSGASYSTSGASVDLTCDGASCI